MVNAHSIFQKKQDTMSSLRFFHFHLTLCRYGRDCSVFLGFYLLSWQDLLSKGLGDLGLLVSDDQFSQLVRYTQLLTQWSQAYNLTAHTEGQDIVVYHLLDSLAAISVMDSLSQSLSLEGRDIHILDVGAGAGLPGIPWAIVRPAWSVDLVDAVLKKVTFMKQVKGLCHLENMTPLHQRVEQIKPETSYDFLVCRAFASLADFLSVSESCLKNFGYAVALKSRSVDAEIRDWEQQQNSVNLSWRLKFVKDLEVPFLQAKRCVVVLQKLNNQT